MIYLDNSATTRPFPSVVDAVTACLTQRYFNPSSAYGPAVETERLIEGYRAQLASALGGVAEEILYTSGATESNNIAVFGTQAKARTRGQLITTKIEHPSIYELFQHMEQRGYEVVYLDVDQYGSVRLDQLQSVLSQKTALISIMQVNNETGAYNDIRAASALIRRHAPQALFHVDGVQAFCKVPFEKVPCDLYSLSGHKFHAMKGVGALYVKKGVPFAGGFIGGGQERGLRSGTTNVPGITSMGAALAAYTKNQAAWIENMRACKLRLHKNLTSISDVAVNGPAPEAGAPHIFNASFLGVKGEVLLHTLSQQGILVSTGSACSAHKKGKNRVLCAMGVKDDRQEGAIRFSLCPQNTLEEMDRAAETIAEAVGQLRRFRRR